MKLFAQITKPNNGYRTDSDYAYSLICKNGPEELYVVDRIEIGRSSTDVYIFVDGQSKHMNSVNLSFFVSESGKTTKEYDIFKNDLNIDIIQYSYINCFTK